MWNDAKRFWAKTVWRSAGLACMCALVAALVTINTHLLRSSLWFVPPGVESGSSFVTLGAYSPEHRFELASRGDLRALNHLGFDHRYAFYNEDQNTIEWAGKTWKNQPIAFVSDGFFDLLGIRMAVGNPFGTANSGVVLDYDFWKDNLNGDQQIVGKTLQIGANSLPVAGVANKEFHGLGAGHPLVWLPDKLRASFLDIAVQGASGANLAALKEVIAEHMPAYHALVALNDPAESAALKKWQVETSTIAASSGGNSEVNVSFNRSNFRPAILAGVDMVPEQTAAVARYVWLLSSLSGVLLFLVALTLMAFWGARTTERGQEIQARHAMGAHISDLLQLFANEALPFLGLVLLLSLPLAWLQLKALHQLEPFRSFLMNRYTDLSIRDFLPSVAVILGIGLIALAAPLLHVLQNATGKRSFGASAGVNRLRSAMAGLQWVLVIAVALLACASLLTNRRMSTASWGGNGNPLLVRLPMDNEQRLLEALHVERASAAIVDTTPLSPLLVKNDSYVPGLDGEGRRLSLYENRWTPAAFQQLGIALRAGRMYDSASESQVVVSESYAAALHVEPHDLLNRPLVRIDMNGKEMPARTIVGVAADVHYNNLRTMPEMVAYIPPQAGREGSTLLLPEYERSLIDAALVGPGKQDDEMAASLRQVNSMRDVRDKSSRTETSLSLATFSYSLLALSLLMLGIVSEAQMQLAHRSRELALIVSVGARLEEAVVRFVRAPLLAMLPAVSLVMLAATLSEHQWLTSFPLLTNGDLGRICELALSVVVVFVVCLVAFAVLRLRSLSLAQLLRLEH